MKNRRLSATILTIGVLTVAVYLWIQYNERQPPMPQKQHHNEPPFHKTKPPETVNNFNHSAGSVSGQQWQISARWLHTLIAITVRIFHLRK